MTLRDLLERLGFDTDTKGLALPTITGDIPADQLDYTIDLGGEYDLADVRFDHADRKVVLS